jgi:hypothetical protein
MKTPTPLADAVVKAFEPPAAGVVGIVDNLLQVCRGGDMELAWRSNACHVRIRQGTVEETLDLSLRKTVFRDTPGAAVPALAHLAGRGRMRGG